MCKVYTKEKSEPLEKRIKNFMDKNNLKLEANVDIVRLCRKFKFNVYKMPLDKEKIDGMILVVDSKNVRKIAVNNLLNLKDARFVIAHELAHYITEKEKISDDGVLLYAKRDEILHGNKKEDIENDMDYMAAAMLVPMEEFIADLHLLKIDIGSITDHKEETVEKVVSNKDIEILSNVYSVTNDVIIRRIAEVSYYI